LTVAFLAVHSLPQRLGLTPDVCALIAFGVPLLAFVLHTVPGILERRRLARLKEITGTGKPGYFQLSPRQDEKSFRRTDGKHIEIHRWLKQPPSPLLYLTGSSGAGKTSVLAAWVIPKLEREGFRVVRLRGFEDPGASLEAALLGLCGEDAEVNRESKDLSRILEVASQRIAHAPLLIVFDQFEEFLILGEGPGRERFLEFLRKEAHKAYQGISILLVFRADYDGFIQDLSLPVPIPGQNLQKVSVFTEAAARDFLVGSGLKFDEKLQVDVLREAAETEGTLGLIRPVTVNLCGLVLSRFATGLPRQFRPRQMVRSFVRESISQPEVADVCHLLLPPLITAHATKTPKSIDELAAHAGLSPRQVQGAMFRLGDPERTIVRSLDSEQTVWEISHDFLVPTIDSMMTEWRVPAWKNARRWLPLAAALVVLAIAVVVPTLLPNPLMDLSARGWTIQVSTSQGTGRYSIACSACQPTDIEGSAWDLRRLPSTFDVTLQGVSSFGATYFPAWRGLKNVRSLSISAKEAPLRDISAADGLPELESLSISGGAEIPPDQLGRLPNSTRSLALIMSGATDAELSRLPSSLTTLTVDSGTVTDAVVPNLPAALAFLALQGTAVTDASVRGLPRHLVYLNLDDDTQITGEEFRYLPRSLQGLDVSRTQVSDTAIPMLPRGLTSLDLSFTKVSDRGLEDLPKSLQLVDLGGTKVTPNGLKRLAPATREAAIRPGSPTFRLFTN